MREREYVKETIVNVKSQLKEVINKFTQINLSNKTIQPTVYCIRLFN